MRTLRVTERLRLQQLCQYRLSVVSAGQEWCVASTYGGRGAAVVVLRYIAAAIVKLPAAPHHWLLTTPLTVTPSHLLTEAPHSCQQPVQSEHQQARS